MVLFLWGPEKDSYLVGNQLRTIHKNLPPGWGPLFSGNRDNAGKIWSAPDVAWASVGPNGLFYVRGHTLENGTFNYVQTQNAQLNADTIAPGLTLDHITFSPGGGWFIRYTDGTVKISSTGTFPESFHTIAGRYMQTRGIVSKVRQPSTLVNVFFGCGESIIIQTLDTYIAHAIPPKASKHIKIADKVGLRFGKNTSLCPWNSQYFFLESEYPPDRRVLGLEFEIWEGDKPLVKILQGMMDCDLYDMPREEKKRWTGLFMAQRPYVGADHITGIIALTMFKSTKVDEGTLNKIWDLSDRDVNGRFSLDEFLIAIRLIYAALRGMGMPETLPISWIPPSADKAVTDMSTVSFDDAGGDVGAMLRDMSLAANWGETENWKEYSGTPAKETSNSTSSASQNLSKPTKQDEASEDGKGGDAHTRKGDDKQLKDSLAASIVSENPNVKWEDVAGLESAKDELQEAVVLPLRFPQMFKGKRQARRGMLLYGPPGTGKSYLAKAIATEVEHTLFSISSSDVMSKWLGDSERLIKLLFQLAREKKPSIIFIDEIDSLCGSRDGPGANPHMQGMKTELLVQMDGVGKDNDGVLVLGATNLPWTLDPAIRRRFQRKIHIPLPDEKARTRLFEIGTESMETNVTKADLEELGRRSVGLSGSDISIVTQDALMQPVKKVQSAKYWRKVNHEGKEYLSPCESHDQGAMEMTWRKVSASQLREPQILAEDFFKVLEKVKPSVSELEIKKCEEWTLQFGQEGA